MLCGDFLFSSPLLTFLLFSYPFLSFSPPLLCGRGRADLLIARESWRRHLLRNDRYKIPFLTSLSSPPIHAHAHTHAHYWPVLLSLPLPYFYLNNFLSSLASFFASPSTLWCCFAELCYDDAPRPCWSYLDVHFYPHLLFFSSLVLSSLFQLPFLKFKVSLHWFLLSASFFLVSSSLWLHSPYFLPLSFFPPPLHTHNQNSNTWSLSLSLCPLFPFLSSPTAPSSFLHTLHYFTLLYTIVSWWIKCSDCFGHTSHALTAKQNPLPSIRITPSPSLSLSKTPKHSPLPYNCCPSDPFHSN